MSFGVAHLATETLEASGNGRFPVVNGPHAFFSHPQPVPTAAIHFALSDVVQHIADVFGETLENLLQRSAEQTKHAVEYRQPAERFPQYLEGTADATPSLSSSSQSYGSQATRIAPYMERHGKRAVDALYGALSGTRKDAPLWRVYPSVPAAEGKHERENADDASYRGGEKARPR